MRRVQGGGGQVVEAWKGRTGEYVYAVIRDPVGAFDSAYVEEIAAFGEVP